MPFAATSILWSLLLSVSGAAKAASPPAEDSRVNAGSGAQVRLHAELGALLPASHTLQYGEEGTNFDLVQDGGQGTLFPFTRLSADLDTAPRTTFVLLVQPLDLRTEAELRGSLVIDDTTIPAGTPVDIRYGFTFYRASYLGDLLLAPDRELALGASLQLRNAVIGYTTVDGSYRNFKRNIGPVPLFKMRYRTGVGDSSWIGAEVDGMYAPIKYFNGSDNDVVGALVDASFRGGVDLGRGTDAFLNLRYLAGGSSGTSRDPDPGSDGYVSDWIHLVSLSVGALLR
jgi:hypothetical protein